MRRNIGGHRNQRKVQPYKKQRQIERIYTGRSKNVAWNNITNGIHPEHQGPRSLERHMLLCRLVFCWSDHLSASELNYRETFLQRDHSQPTTNVIFAVYQSWYLDVNNSLWTHNQPKPFSLLPLLIFRRESWRQNQPTTHGIFPVYQSWYLDAIIAREGTTPNDPCHFRCYQSWYLDANTTREDTSSQRQNRS